MAASHVCYGSTGARHTDRVRVGDFVCVCVCLRACLRVSFHDNLNRTDRRSERRIRLRTLESAHTSLGTGWRRIRTGALFVRERCGLCPVVVAADRRMYETHMYMYMWMILMMTFDIDSYLGVWAPLSNYIMLIDRIRQEPWPVSLRWCSMRINGSQTYTTTYIEFLCSKKTVLLPATLLHGTKYASTFAGMWQRFTHDRFSNLRRSDHPYNSGDSTSLVRFCRSYRPPAHGKPGRLYCAQMRASSRRSAAVPWLGCVLSG